MFTDVEGFTALLESDEQLALAKRDKYTSVLQEKHEAFGGTIVQFFGDGSLSTFPTPSTPCVCDRSPAGVPRAARSSSAHRPPRRQRMVEPTCLVGDAVIIASCIESFGCPARLGQRLYPRPGEEPAGV